MTYNKPQLKVNAAITAIQHVDDKSDPQVTDTFPLDPLFPSPIAAPAYQADE